MASWVPETWVVQRRVRETRDTVTLTLVPARAESLCRFGPGQFNMLYAHGVGEIPVSISGGSEGGHSLLHTIREVGAVSRAMCALRSGATVGLRGPFGTPWPVEKFDGKDVFIVAGGLGLAPLRPAVEAVAARRARYGDVSLFYGGRSPAGLLFPRALRLWSKTNNIRVLTTVDQAAPGWSGRVGVVTSLLPPSLRDASSTAALLCGPEVMMRFAAMDLVRLGIPAEQIFLSMERNMKCAVGLCGRCQLHRHFICKDGPVFALSEIQELLSVREL